MFKLSVGAYQRQLLMIASAAMFSPIGCDNSSGRYWAHYPDKSFSGSKEMFFELYTGNDHRQYKVADLYLKLNTGDKVKLADISQETAKQWVMQKSDVLRDSSVMNYTDFDGVKLTGYNVDGISILVFRDGKLVGCGINGKMSHGPFVDVQLSSSKEGEFLSFPISREDLIREFGKPDRIVQSSMEPK